MDSKKRIAITTDTNSGMLPGEGENDGIFVLPMPFFINEELFFEDISLSQEQFYQKLLEDADISTSQPSPGEVMDLWDKVLKEYEEIVHIPMSSGLSKSCETAVMLAQDYEGKVHVVDNQRISVTQRRSVMDAMELVAKGTPAAEIKRILEEMKLESSIYITLETLKYLKKGGRITPAAAAIGTGTVTDGACNISLGTSGTVFIAQDRFSVDEQNALHSFAHANGKYHLMGCILSAASCNQWWLEEIIGTKNYAAEQGDLERFLGKNDVFFLPYLMGERSPHNDVSARGAFFGMRPDTTRKQMTLAVMEGVAFALRDCLEVAKKSGLKIEKTKICGGGAKSEIWKKIIANVLGISVSTLCVEEGPAYGAAILAMVGAGEYEDVERATSAIVQVKETVYPDAVLMAAYDEKYQIFKQAYPALKGVFAQNKR